MSMLKLSACLSLLVICAALHLEKKQIGEGGHGISIQDCHLMGSLERCNACCDSLISADHPAMLRTCRVNSCKSFFEQLNLLG
ncbi:hypothetical protein V1264_016249 [Littorina saxatilis]|uniref:Uncharacterized protein n=1 Tax=Littorina saxatilis TaxID=31220 RepID=A0AAN9GHX2_9CAEN